MLYSDKNQSSSEPESSKAALYSTALFSALNYFSMAYVVSYSSGSFQKSSLANLASSLWIPAYLREVSIMSVAIS